MVFKNAASLAATFFAAAATASPVVSPRGISTTNPVFAHYMVGLTSGQSADQWAADVQLAKDAGIDGFVLNMGPNDTWNADQLPMAYAAAAGVEGFSVFISFDMNADAGYNWSVEQVSGWLQTVASYDGYSAQYMVNDVPMVSTFEGPAWSDNWQGVRDQVAGTTGGVYVVPDWASIGPDGVNAKLGTIDGAFSWSSWPLSGQTQKTEDEDNAYLNYLNAAGKPYMMGVSPYFYVNAAGKNWYCSSDSLWFDRWKQVLELKPAMIEIITWNDFSESAYIADIVEAQIYPESTVYVEGMDHSAFRFILPYFISAYKSGDTNVALPNGEGAMAWYRTTSATVCGDGGTVWGQGGSESAASGTSDVISIIALSDSGAAPEVSVTINGAAASVNQVDSVGKAYFFTASFSGMTGDVAVTVNGASTTGPAISADCPATGVVNFNAVAIQI